MSRVNVELKARDDDPEATLARCLALGASDHGMLHQRDTYFAATRGRLKLRSEAEGSSTLIGYRRPDSLAATESRYVLAAVCAPETLSEALDATLGTVVVVAKRRRLLIWQGVRIHLDDVDELGTFVELEAVIEGGAGEGAIAEGHERMARLVAELAIRPDALVQGGYADLLLEGPRVLLATADAAMRNAHAPYSQFKVGAAVRGRSGAIYAGANVENAAYPQGQCAEASALGALVTAGETEITAAAVVAERLEHCPPCGGCRQRLAEFGDRDVPLYLGRPGAGAPLTVTLGELLPGSFGAEALEG